MREREGRSRRPPRGRQIDDDDGDDGRRGTRDDRREACRGIDTRRENTAWVLARHARAAGVSESHSRRGRDPPPRAAAVPTCSTDETATASDTFSRDTTDSLFDHTNESYAR